MGMCHALVPACVHTKGVQSLAMMTAISTGMAMRENSAVQRTFAGSIGTEAHLMRIEVGGSRARRVGDSYDRRSQS